MNEIIKKQNNAVSNPLQKFIKKAAGTLPEQTGAANHAINKMRMDRQVIILDTSGSMAYTGAKLSRISELKVALEQVWSNQTLIAFSNTAREISSPLKIPTPQGGTALDKAFLLACRYDDLGHTLVISDGEPDDEDEALAAASRLSGSIDIIYCGDPENQRAIDFMNALVRNRGKMVQHNWNGSLTLTQNIQKLLPAR